MAAIVWRRNFWEGLRPMFLFFMMDIRSSVKPIRQKVAVNETSQMDWGVKFPRYR